MRRTISGGYWVGKNVFDKELQPHGVVRSDPKMRKIFVHKSVATVIHILLQLDECRIAEVYLPNYIQFYVNIALSTYCCGNMNLLLIVTALSFLLSN